MLNNKGQTLVVFVLLIPILLLIFAIIIDSGYAYIEKRKIENYIKDAIEYWFDVESEDEEIITNIQKKFAKLQLNPAINITNNYIKISVETEYDSLFDLFIKQSSHDIKLSYVGILENNELVIRKE
ncbi:MAG: hypothetical protein PHH93_13065 [Prolixibacteraceae bacterium]|nr:hypothetical protein [Prolixibacteraceae bacterium]